MTRNRSSPLSIRRACCTRPRSPRSMVSRSLTSGARPWRGSPCGGPVDCHGRSCVASTRGSVLRRESVRAGWVMSILRRSQTSFAERYPKRRYPAILLGSSNGALTHLAAAMQVPWLPDTVLVPVARVGDVDRPDHAMDFGRSVASALLDRNPDVALHHMHDQLQDALMAERMSYFRLKWRRLPAAYAAFVDNNLVPNGTVVVLHDHSAWPVTRIGPRHVFQAGGRGGTPPEGYLARPHTPSPTTRRPNPSGASTPISAMTCEAGALSAAIAMQRLATTDRKPRPQQWPR